jgi:hypothetical protein
MAFIRFVRTGDLDMLRFAIAHALHVEDVHQVHLGPDNAVTGGCRYCPPTNHISADGMQPMISTQNPSHHKTQGMFESYYLTGSERALEIALEGSDWVRHYGYSFTQGDNLATYVRRLSHLLYSQVNAYVHTKNRDYHTTMYQNWFFIKRAINNRDSVGQTWMEGLFYEALANMYEVCDDSITDSIPYYLKIQADRHYNFVSDNAALGYAFLSQWHGDVYKNRALTKMNYFDPYYDDTFKIFALYGRNLERTLYYFAIPESLDVAIPVERNKGIPENKSPIINVFPNPFNQITKIAFSYQSRPGGTVSNADLHIFNVNGKIIKKLTADNRQLTAGIPWNASDLPAGIYIIKLKLKNRTLSRKIILFR